MGAPRKQAVYPLDREQWTGYETAFIQIDSGERETFVTIAAGFEKPQGELPQSWETSEAAAWRAFDLGLKDWLKDKPGIVLWRMEPTLHFENERIQESDQEGFQRVRYYVCARIAVTEDRRFTDPEHFMQAA